MHVSLKLISALFCRTRIYASKWLGGLLPGGKLGSSSAHFVFSEGAARQGESLNSVKNNKPKKRAVMGIIKAVGLLSPRSGTLD